MTGKKDKPGPKPDRVKIDEDWEDAIGKALKKKRPKKGWPKPGKDDKERLRESAAALDAIVSADNESLERVLRKLEIEAYGAPIDDEPHSEDDKD